AEQQIVAGPPERPEAVVPEVEEMIADIADDIVRRVAEEGEDEPHDQADDKQLDNRPTRRVAQKSVHPVSHPCAPPNLHESHNPRPGCAASVSPRIRLEFFYGFRRLLPGSIFASAAANLFRTCCFCRGNRPDGSVSCVFTPAPSRPLNTAGDRFIAVQYHRIE